MSDGNELISWVAQQISTVTRLIHDKHAPDYQKQEREKLYPTKPGSLKFRGLAPGLSWAHWSSSYTTFCCCAAASVLFARWHGCHRMLRRVVPWCDQIVTCWCFSVQPNKLTDRPVCLTAGLYDGTAVPVADVVAWLVALRPTCDGCHAGRSDDDLSVVAHGCPALAWPQRRRDQHSRQQGLK